MRKMLLFISASLMANSAYAQQTQAPPPPCQADIYHAFDFWVGEWDVFNKKGKKAGENSITVQENGCLLLEKWTSAGGGTGQSYNFYDLTVDKWRQVWISQSSVIDYTGGINADGAMVLKGTISNRNGTKSPFKGVWTPNEEGTVTQHFQQYNSKTETWNDWFVGTYKRKPITD